MASVEEIVTSLQAVIDELNDAAAAATAAVEQTDQAFAQAAGMGAAAFASGLSAGKETIEKIGAHIPGIVELANEAITQIRAAADGTP